MPLPLKIADTLLILVENRARPVHKEELLKAVWPDVFIEESNLTHNISVLRKTLGDTCIRTIPKRGYQFVAVVREVEAEPVAVRPAAAEANVAAPALEPKRRLSIRERWMPWLLAAVGVAAAAGAAGWRLVQGPAAKQLVLTQLTTDTGLTYQPTLSLDGKLLAYVSDRSTEGNLNIYVQQLPRSEPIRLTNHASDDHEPSFSPDATHIAFASDRDGGGIYVIPTLGGDARKIADRGRRPRFSPDGRWIAYWAGHEHSGGGVFVVPSTGGQPRLLTGGRLTGRSPIWTPDGEHVLFYATDPTGSFDDWVVASRDGRSLATTGAFEVIRRYGLDHAPDVNWAIFPEAWAGKDQVVFSAKFGDSINLWKISIDPKSWQIRGEPQRLTAGSGFERDASSDSGGRLVFSSLTRNLDIWGLPVDASTGKIVGELKQLTRGAADDTSPSVSDDGKRLAFESNRTGKQLVWTKDLETGEERALTDMSSDNNLPMISHDGSKVAYSIVESRLSPSHWGMYVVPFGGGPPTKLCRGYATSWSPDGNKILYQGFEESPVRGQVGLVDVASGNKVDVLLHSKYLLMGSLSPDGRWISFSAITGPGPQVQRFLVRFREGGPLPESEWVPVPTDGAYTQLSNQGGGLAWAWSPDGIMGYDANYRDGFLCIWAWRVDPKTNRTIGPPRPIYHFHSARRSLANVLAPRKRGPSVARDKLVFALGDLTGNIWMAEPQKQR